MQRSNMPCGYLKRREQNAKTLSWDPNDIEELHRIGKESLACPYYLMKDRAEGADVIFMPYNYLVDEKYRENFNINF